MLLTSSLPCLPSSCPTKPVSLTKQQKDQRPWFLPQKSELQKFWLLKCVFFFFKHTSSSKTYLVAKPDLSCHEALCGLELSHLLSIFMCFTEEIIMSWIVDLSSGGTRWCVEYRIRKILNSEVRLVPRDSDKRHGSVLNCPLTSQGPGAHPSAAGTR